MESFVYLALSIAVFLQLTPPQLCNDIQGFEIIHKNKDGLVDSRIDINFISSPPVEEVVENNLPINRQNLDVIDVNITCVENLCENVPNYPYDKINDALKKITFGVFPPLQDNVNKIANRLSFSEVHPVCLTSERTIFPKMARNIKNEEKYIVNIPGLQQAVTVSICRPNAGGCGSKVSFPTGYISECIQGHSQVQLLSFDTENGAAGFVPKYDVFQFPSCCECSIKEI